MTSSTPHQISELLGKLGEFAPEGYALGFHVQLTTTKFLFQTYRKDWLDHYSQNGLVMSDPIVAWSFENTGAKRWSDLDDPAGVLVTAAEYNMKYGVVCAISHGGTSSMAGCSRAEREYTDAEIDQLQAYVEA